MRTVEGNRREIPCTDIPGRACNYAWYFAHTNRKDFDPALPHFFLLIQIAICSQSDFDFYLVNFLCYLLDEKIKHYLENTYRTFLSFKYLISMLVLQQRITIQHKFISTIIHSIS